MSKIELPLTTESRKELKAGDLVELSGVIYTARDRAHKRLVRMIESGEGLPFDLQDQTIYYVGPAPARPGEVVGSIGPTTSSRMDPFTPAILKAGVKGMIGKGNRSEEVIKAIKRHRAIYFVATGGAAVYLSQFVIKMELVAWQELGPEAIHRLTVADLPLVVAIDSDGNNVFDR